MTRITRIIFAGILLTTLTGCWDQKPVEDRALVVAVGIQPIPHSTAWRWTFVFPNPTESVSSLSALPPNQQFYSLDVKAAGFPQALMALQQRMTRDIYFGQFRALVLSPRLSAHNWIRLINTFNRSGRILKTYWIVAGLPTSQVAHSTPPSEGGAFYSLFKALACRCQPYIWAQRAWTTWSRVVTPGVSPVVPVARYQTNHLILENLATVGSSHVFVWSPAASQGYAYLTQHVTKGAFTVTLPNRERVGITRIRGTSRTRIIRTAEGVSVHVTMRYQGMMEDLPTNAPDVPTFERDAEQAAARHILALSHQAMTLAEQEHTDPFGWHRHLLWQQDVTSKPWPTEISWNGWHIYMQVQFRVVGEGVAE